MRRALCLTTLTVAGVLLTVVSNEARQTGHRIRPLELADSLYMLTSDPTEQGMRTGGNTAVFVTSTGVVLVDTKIRGYGRDILAEVRKITDQLRAARTTHTGDMMARKGLPFIDSANTNGSATEFGATLLKAVDGIRDVDTIIPGHADDPLTWEDLVDYAAFYDNLLTTVQQGAADGRSPAQIVDGYTVPDQYRDFQAPANRVESIVQLIHAGQ